MKTSTRGRLYLIKDFNCALATMEALQDATGLRDDYILKAVAGLEGGVVASGSTCGVVTGGAIFLSKAFDEEIVGGGIPAGVLLLEKVREYVDWFRERFGTTLCRERAGVDFYKVRGQLRYFLPGNRVCRCLYHIGKSVEFVENSMREGLSSVDGSDLSIEVLGTKMATPGFCANEVLRRVRERTGIGSKSLERISVVLDGGVGLSGGVCGALSGAIIAMNSLFGADVRRASVPQNIMGFVVGHINLLKNRPIKMPEPFGIGREIVTEFKKVAGSLECLEISGREFLNLSDFEAFAPTAEKCREIIEIASDLSSRAIERWN